MPSNPSKASGVGLERSCGDGAGGWMRSSAPAHGIECMEAWFRGPAYRPHRHDSYAFCVTTSGVQAFGYRGASETSVPGQVVVLHPDELHDGSAATADGFGYRIVYVDPALIFAAVQALRGTGALPFARQPVLASPTLSAAIHIAFAGVNEPLARDSLVQQLAEGLLAAAPGYSHVPVHLDLGALERVRQFLSAEHARVVHSRELEALSGLSRYELARQFRRRYGTSPYRFLLMRRLDAARQRIAAGTPLVEVALDAGFADQAHLTRMFRAAFGLTPARYAALRAD